VTDTPPIKFDDWFLKQMPIIDRAIAFVCNSYNVRGADAEDFASSVKLKLLENDYAVLRKYKGAGFSTFIFATVRHWYLDQRIHEWGKWRPSAEAKRLGAAAVELENHLFRDGRPLEQVVPIVAAHHGIPAEEVRALAGRLRPHLPRPRPVSLDQMDRETRSMQAVDRRTLDGDYADVVHRATDVIRQFLETLPEQERVILRLRFFAGQSVAEIASSLKVERNWLYRQINKRMAEIRERLAKTGVLETDLDEVIARIPDDFAKCVRNAAGGPSMDRDPSAEEGAKT
jgi:RNA polymerase sigma factor (sigma-70 family)